MANLELGMSKKWKWKGRSYMFYRDSNRLLETAQVSGLHCVVNDCAPRLTGRNGTLAINPPVSGGESESFSLRCGIIARAAPNPPSLGLVLLRGRTVYVGPLPCRKSREYKSEVGGAVSNTNQSRFLGPAWLRIYSLGQLGRPIDREKLLFVCGEERSPSVPPP